MVMQGGSGLYVSALPQPQAKAKEEADRKAKEETERKAKQEAEVRQAAVILSSMLVWYAATQLACKECAQPAHSLLVVSTVLALHPWAM
jgi:hypothetical protein